MDIDELSIKGESINCLGGQLGEILFVFNEILSHVAQEKNNIDIKKIMKEFIKEFLNTGFAGVIPNKAEVNPPNEKNTNNNSKEAQPSLELPNTLTIIVKKLNQVWNCLIILVAIISFWN